MDPPSSPDGLDPFEILRVERQTRGGEYISLGQSFGGGEKSPFHSNTRRGYYLLRLLLLGGRKRRNVFRLGSPRWTNASRPPRLWDPIAYFVGVVSLDRIWRTTGRSVGSLQIASGFVQAYRKWSATNGTHPFASRGESEDGRISRNRISSRRSLRFFFCGSRRRFHHRKTGRTGR